MNDTNFQGKKWTFFEKLLLRFGFIFTLLFSLLYFNVFPFFAAVTKFLANPLHVFVPWFADNFLSLEYPITVFSNGSGDTTYDYVLLLIIAIISLTGCLIWTGFGGKRLNYNYLYYLLSAFIRFYLAFILIQYGLGKVIKLQFAFPDLDRLTKAYGDSSPMGLAWTFLGFSKGYNLFMGIIELLGVLLLFRKTVSLGAIIALMTTAQIMAINYFYDVPVKILSTALVLMSLFLLAPNFRQLVNFFLKGEAAKLSHFEVQKTNKRWIFYCVQAFKYILILSAVLVSFTNIMNARTKYGDGAAKLPLYGVYNVEVFIWNKDTLREDATETRRWQKLIIQRKDYSSVKFMNGHSDYCNLYVDTAGKIIDLVFHDELQTSHRFIYQSNGQENLILKGSLYGNPVKIKMRKQEFQLTETGFRWINEYPFNR